jgi:sugar (pentulose or hexulose) kinase
LDTTEILFAIDVGTTYCKAALFGLDGSLLRAASRVTPVERAPAGHAYIDPQALWQAIVDVIRELTRPGLPGPLAAIGIASMAETGLLIDRDSRIARTPLIPGSTRQRPPGRAPENRGRSAGTFLPGRYPAEFQVQPGQDPVAA